MPGTVNDAPVNSKRAAPTSTRTTHLCSPFFGSRVAKGMSIDEISDYST